MYKIPLRLGKSFATYTSMLMPMLLLMGLTVGLNTGYQADSVADAKIERGEDYQINESSYNQSEFDPYPYVPDKWQPTVSGESSPHLRTFVENTVEMTLSFASAVSIFTFHNKGWLRPFWVRPALWVATLSYVGGVVWWQKRRLSGVFG